MIVSGDKRASSAFLEGLHVEPAPNVTPLNGRNILQVSGLEQAIAIADDEVRERARSKPEPDTDDVAAPATYQPYVPTPVPPHADDAQVLAVPQLASLPNFPAPIVVLDRKLFFHPPPPAGLGYERARKRRWFAVAAALVVPFATLIALVMVFRGSASWQPEPPVAKAPLAVTTLAPPAAKLVHPHDAEVLTVEGKALKPTPAKRRR